jgi:hypothetical protein
MDSSTKIAFQFFCIGISFGSIIKEFVIHHRYFVVKKRKDKEENKILAQRLETLENEMFEFEREEMKKPQPDNQLRLSIICHDECLKLKNLGTRRN